MKSRICFTGRRVLLSERFYANNFYSTIRANEAASLSDAEKPYKSKITKSIHLLENLLKNVLYENEHFVAIAKPNGYPMHDPKYNDRKVGKNVSLTEWDDTASMSYLKSELMKKYNSSEIFEVFSQKHLHGGIVVYCFNKDVRNILSRFYKNAKINKHHICEYKAISVGKMNKQEGLEQMTIERMPINNNLMSLVVKEPSNAKQRMRNKYANVTMKFEIIKSAKIAYNCTVNYLSIRPTLTKWDSVELFFIHKMSPLLGDHVYSSRVRTVLDKQVLIKPEQAFPEPQDLPKDVCDLLGVQENETVKIPTHLYCTKLIVPKLFRNQKGEIIFSKKSYNSSLVKCEQYPMKRGEDFEKENIIQSSDVSEQNEYTVTIEAPLPDFYVETLKRLKLYT